MFTGTRIAQPADVRLNQVIKHHLKQVQMNYLVESHQKQIASGLSPQQVKFTTSLPALRNVSVAGIVNVYKFMMGPIGRNLVRRSVHHSIFVQFHNSQVWTSQAWKNCTAKGWNFSRDCLTSKKAQSALNA